MCGAVATGQCGQCVQGCGRGAVCGVLPSSQVDVHQRPALHGFSRTPIHLEKGGGITMETVIPAEELTRPGELSLSAIALASGLHLEMQDSVGPVFVHAGFYRNC